VRALLDTHAFLWFNADDPRLGRNAHALISGAEHEVILSAASAWEIAIKYSLGRLEEVNEPPHSYVPARIAHYGFAQLPVEFRHTFQVALLPHYHRDPFDRLLIAQAQVEGLPILTSDPNIARYDVETIW
jgi:PIN domain nuclease of toxin-antitoxin system